jgi:hypothetical protein
MPGSLQLITISRRVAPANLDLHMTLLCGLAPRLRLVDYPAERRIGSSR